MATEAHAVFGDLLRHARRDAGLTQEELAERAGLSTRAISDLERGINRSPRRDTLEMLAEALELPPAERALWEHARQRLAVRAMTAAIPDAQPANVHLPTPLTNFIGREREIADVVEWLRRPDTRMLTLIGTGGVGKTRLSLAVAREVANDYPDGIWFVNLAPLNDPSFVLPEIATTLDISLSGQQPVLSALTAALMDKRVLLLLDNVEHVVQAALELPALVHACPRLNILATSRVPLHVQGEREYPLSPLELPDLDDISDLGQLGRTEAVALFIQRAQAISSVFSLTDHNGHAVAEICHRLDGIPLAIELAAARTRIIPPQTMRQRLEQRLSLLTGGPRDLPLRQQTLRDTIAWSYDLLTPDEQRLFRQLSVFRGGWTLEAAGAVTGESGNTLDNIERLVEHSLVRAYEEPDGEPRYSMLETIREFGLERLADEHEEERAYRLHGQYFLQLAESAMPTWRSRAEAEWAVRLEIELDNLRVALSWFMEHDVESVYRLSGALWRFFTLYGHHSEGLYWLETALGQAQPVPPAVRARVLEGIGIFAYMMSDYPVARARCEETLAIWETLGDLKGQAWMLHGLGRVAYETGDYPAAELTYNRSLAIYRELGDLAGIADMLNVLGVIASGVYGEYDRARSLYEESLELRREVGDSFGIQQSLGNLGENAIETGDYLRARSLIEESLAWGRKHHLTNSAAMELRHLGMLALRQGDDKRALPLLAESIQLFQHEGSTAFVVKDLMLIAELTTHQRQPSRAACIGGSIEAISAQIRLHIPPQDQIAHERVLVQARCQADPEEWLVAWARGRAISLDEAVEFALSDHSSDSH